MLHEGTFKVISFSKIITLGHFKTKNTRDSQNPPKLFSISTRVKGNKSYIPTKNVLNGFLKDVYKKYQWELEILK